MKNLIIVSTALALVTSANAASVTINNITGDGQDLAFGDSLGSPLVSGFVAIYTFEMGSIPSSAAELQGNGNNGQLGFAAFDSSTGSNSPDPGAFTFDFTILNDAVKDLYVVIGDGDTLASSTVLGLLNSSVQLDGDDSGSPTGDNASYNAKGGAEILIGAGGRGDVDWSGTLGPSYTTNILSLSAAIPEPSSVLLLGIGFLAAGARRRR